MQKNFFKNLIKCPFKYTFLFCDEYELNSLQNEPTQTASLHPPANQRFLEMICCRCSLGSDVFQLVAVRLPQSADQLLETKELSSVLGDVSSNPAAVAFGRAVRPRRCFVSSCACCSRSDQLSPPHRENIWHRLKVCSWRSSSSRSRSPTGSFIVPKRTGCLCPSSRKLFEVSVTLSVLFLDRFSLKEDNKNGGRNTFTCVACHPKDDCVATGHEDGKIRLW